MSYIHRNLLPLIVGLLASVAIVIGVGTVAVNAWGSPGLSDEQFDRELARRLDGAVPGASATLGLQLDPDLKVTVLIPHGPGDLAGIHLDDRLVAVAGSEVRTVDEARARLAAVPRNTEYAVTVTRDGQRTELKSTKGAAAGNLGGLFQRFTERMPQFGAGAPAGTPPAQPSPGLPQQGPVLGVSLQPVGGGLRVINVTPDSPAAAAGVVADDVLTAANGRPTPSLEALQAILQSAGSGGAVTLSVTRAGQPVTLNAHLAPRA